MDHRSEITGNPMTTEDLIGARPLHQISWAAIFGGTFIGLGILLVLGTLGMAVGASILNPTSDQNVGNIAIGQAIWWGISGIIAFFVAGWTTSVFSGFVRGNNGVANGLATWGVMIVIAAVGAVSTVGVALGGGLSLLKTSSHVVGSVVKENVSQPLVESAVKALSNNNQDGAETRISQEAREAANTATKAAAGVGWALFIMMVLEGVAAAIGGSFGSRYSRRQSYDNGEITQDKHIKAAA